MKVKDYLGIPIDEHWEDTLRRRYRRPSVPCIMRDCIVKEADATYVYK